MIPHAVVVARQPAVVVLRESRDGPFRRRAARQRDREDVPPPVVGRRHERDARAVGRPARLDVDGGVGRDGLHGLRRQIQQLQLDRVVHVPGEDDEPSIGGPVGLVVVSLARGQLLCDARADPLPPQRALHRVDQLGPVGRPRDGARTARHLRDVHLAPVVGMRHADLLQDRLALSLHRHGGDGSRPGGDQD